MYEDYGRTFASFYDELFPHGEMARPAVDFLAGLAAEASTPTIMEFGAGTGRIALPLAARGLDVVAVDISQEMLDVLEANGRASAVAIDTLQGDIRSIDAGRSFGVVACMCATLSVLIDIEHQVEVVANAARHLVPGGLLVVETHNPAAVLTLHAGAPQHTSVTPYPNGAALVSSGIYDPRSGLWQLTHLFHAQGRDPQVAMEVSRPVWPTELDLMARLAGLTLVGRFGDFDRRRFLGREAEHLSVYRKPE